MTDITPDDLKKCPFCGNDASLIDEEKGQYRIKAICWSCGCQTGSYEYGYDRVAKEVWNKRR